MLEELLPPVNAAAMLLPPIETCTMSMPSMPRRVFSTCSDAVSRAARLVPTGSVWLTLNVF